MLRKNFLQKLVLDAVERSGRLLVHLLRETEVGYADDVVAACLGRVCLQLLVGKIHVTQRLEDAREVYVAFAHRQVLVNGYICLAACVQPRRVCNVAAVHGLVEGISQQHVGQLVARILEHVAYIALALIVEEAVREE